MKAYFSSDILDAFSDVNFKVIEEIFVTGVNQNPVIFNLNEIEDMPEVSLYHILIYLKNLNIIEKFSKSEDDLFYIYINKDVYKMRDVLIVDDDSAPPEYSKVTGKKN